MFRRMITRMALPAVAGLSLLLVGGPAKASEQGWPILGRNWSYYGRSYPTSSGSYAPSYYATYPTSIPQTGGYYGFASPPHYYPGSTTEGYYGSMATEDYYSPSKRPVRVNVQVPSDAKMWFDGSQTNQTGATRSFESPPMAVGPEYAYQIQIQWKQNGKDVTQTRQIKVHAGDVINLTLGAPEVAMAP